MSFFSHFFFILLLFPLLVHSDLVTSIYGKLTSFQRSQADICNLVQLLSAPHPNWDANAGLASLKNLFKAFSSFSPDQIRVSWFCDLLKVWSLALDRAFQSRFCLRGSDIWCSYDANPTYQPGTPCTAYFCGKNPGARCQNSATWGATCASKRRCPVTCLRIVGTTKGTYANLSNYMYALSASNKRGKSLKRNAMVSRLFQLFKRKAQKKQSVSQSCNGGCTYCDSFSDSCDNCANMSNGSPCTDYSTNSCCFCLVVS